MLGMKVSTNFNLETEKKDDILIGYCLLNGYL